MEIKSKIINLYEKYRPQNVVYICVSLSIFAVLLGYYFLISAPHSGEKKINVKEGSSLMQISTLLEKEKVVRSSLFFRVAVILSGGENSIKAGTYLFSGNNNTAKAAERLMKGEYGVPVQKITITEGMSSVDILKLFQSGFSSLDTVVLEQELKKNEGYLFPDTYFIPLAATSSDVIKMLSTNFEHRTSNINISSSKTSKNINEIITMASIIEGEAKTDQDRKIVSGILWKRISIGMPLQVDATFLYINGKGSLELTLKDLKVDSAYNTYKNKGLPPGPINNPGLEAIEAAMYPVESQYLYYLSDNAGIMHYAKTFEEHKKNKEKYLK